MLIPFLVSVSKHEWNQIVLISKTRSMRRKPMFLHTVQ
jgi:hypothetical protein